MLKNCDEGIVQPHRRARRNELAALGHGLTDRRVLQVLAFGFASGLPLPLTYTTLSASLATAGVRRSAIGTFALVGTPYAFKFLWSPLIDRLPPPLGWGGDVAGE